VGSGLAGFAVLLAMLIGWWLFSGNGPGGPPGSASRMTQPGSATVPISSGPTTPPRTVPDGLPLVSWAEEGTTLRLTYRRGDDCFRGLRTPRVRETDVAVEIVLLRAPVDGTCPLTTTGTVLVDLDGPVGDRSVLDGSYVDRRVRVRPAP
jgi:hypothetical protein